MTYDVDIAGVLHQVVLERTGNRFAVSVDGRPHEVDLLRPSPGSLSLLVADEASGRIRAWDVGITEGRNGDMTLHLNGTTVAARVSTSRGLASRGRGTAAADHAGPARIAAPMPGKIVRVLVRAGDLVRPRQGVVVVEAMKMENELRSPKEGRVREVRVTEGMSVEAGAVLVIVD